MSVVSLDFYGVRAEIFSQSPEALSEMSRDFAWFRAGDPGEPAVRIGLFLSPPPRDRFPNGSPASIDRRHISDRGSVRTVLQPGDALVVHDFARETGEVHCDDPHRLHELAYILLLSRVGEKLDLKGMHRVHALGLVWDGRAVLYLAPVRGGKTTLALRFLNEKDVRLLSEDTPLVDRNGNLWPFPVRFGLVGGDYRPEIPRQYQRLFHRRDYGSKVLVDIDYAADRWAARGPVPAEVLLVGDGFAQESSMAPASFLDVFRILAVNLVIGVGIPQGREYVLRTRGLLRLGMIAFCRLRAMMALMRRCRAFRLRLGPDADRNLIAIRQALRPHTP